MRHHFRRRRRKKPLTPEQKARRAVYSAFFKKLNIAEKTLALKKAAALEQEALVIRMRFEARHK